MTDPGTQHLDDAVSASTASTASTAPTAHAGNTKAPRVKIGRNVCYLCPSTQCLRGISVDKLQDAAYLLQDELHGRELPQHASENRLCATCYPAMPEISVLGRVVAVQLEDGSSVQGRVARPAGQKRNAGDKPNDRSRQSRSNAFRPVVQQRKISPSSKWDVLYMDADGEEKCVVMRTSEVWTAAGVYKGQQKIDSLRSRVGALTKQADALLSKEAVTYRAARKKEANARKKEADQAHLAGVVVAKLMPVYRPQPTPPLTPGTLQTCQVSEAATAIRELGLCLLEGAVDPTMLPGLQQHCFEAFNESLRALVLKQLMAAQEDRPTPCVKYSEIIERDGGRFDCRHRMSAEPCSSILQEGGAAASLLPIIHRVLGTDMRVVTIGQVVAMSEAGWAEMLSDNEQESTHTLGNQAWHADGPHLFDDADADGQPSGAVFPTHVLPAHALNVFIPLVDLTPQSGATQFALGTHKLGAHAMPIRYLTSSDTGAEKLSEAHAPRTTVPYMPAGSAVVFDYRLWHRGLQNLGLADRPVLYAVVAKPWWRDHRNFQTERSLFNTSESDALEHAPDADALQDSNASDVQASSRPAATSATAPPLEAQMASHHTSRKRAREA